MKSKLVIALVVFGAVLPVGEALAVESTTPPSLAGSWQFTLTQTPPAPVSAPPIHALATFTSDGSVIETDTSEVSPISAAVRTAIRATGGHGIWQPAPAFGNLYIQFISLVVNPNGSLYARKTVTIGGALDSGGNNFSGSYSFVLADPNGGVLTTGSGTVAGQRIPHPALP